MRQRILHHVRLRPAAYLTVGVLIGAGGSYALAAGTARTISVCADKATGVMHLRMHGRCNRSQTGVSWNQRGPQGTPGKQGPPGAPAVSIWGEEGFNGVPGAEHGLSIQRVAPGTYQVTVTALACAHAFTNAPWVSILDGNPPAGHAAGAFPVAWTTPPISGQFTVYTGVVAGGVFTASDEGLNIYDTC